MYAIVDIAGQQFKVERGRKIFVHRLQANEGADVEFDKVMLIENEGKISVGSPLIDGAKVSATVLSHVKDHKVIVFKKKRRKGYQKWNGHRQQFTELIIHGILGKGETLKSKYEVKVHAPKVKHVEEVVEKVEEVVAEKPAKKTRKKKEA